MPTRSLKPPATILEWVRQELEHLRPLPAAATQAIRMLTDPQMEIGRLAGVLETDQVLAAQVLRHANSAYYGGLATCSSVAEGIMRIGTRQLRSVLYSVAAGGMLTARLTGYRLRDGELFRHSFVTAAATRRLAELLRYPEPEEAYAAGLLHDLGKLLLDRHLLPRYAAMAADVARGRTIIEVEEMHLGADHATIGGLMADRWAFPRRLADAIRYHHAPSLAQQPRLAAMVGLVNVLVLQAGIGLTPLGVPPIPPETPQYLRVLDEQIGRLAYALRPAIEAANRQFDAGLHSQPLRQTGALRARLG